MNREHEGVSVDLNGVHSGFPKEFTNFGLDLSIFPESHARGGCKAEYGIDSFVWWENNKKVLQKLQGGARSEDMNATL